MGKYVCVYIYIENMYTSKYIKILYTIEVTIRIKLRGNYAWYSFHGVTEKEHLFRWSRKESWRRQRNCRDRKFLQFLHLDFERDTASVRLQADEKR